MYDNWLFIQVTIYRIKYNKEDPDPGRFVTLNKWVVFALSHSFKSLYYLYPGQKIIKKMTQNY